MTANQFLDTNNLVYAFDSSESVKQEIAKQRLAEAATSATGRLSTQVLGEFFHATVIRRRLMTAAEAARSICAFQAAYPVAAIDPALVAEAIAVHQRYQLRFWGPLIVATANRHGCTVIVNEDLNHGHGQRLLAAKNEI